MARSLPPMTTPCIGVCTIDPENDICQGCHRTLVEIAHWGVMTEAERLAVMARLPGRVARREQS